MTSRAFEREEVKAQKTRDPRNILLDMKLWRTTMR
jgi:hypothetical protein